MSAEKTALHVAPEKFVAARGQEMQQYLQSVSQPAVLWEPTWGVEWPADAL